MDDNVRIRIKTYQDIDGESGEPIELESTGIFGEVNGKFVLKYKESEMTGFPNTTTTLKICKESVVVSRSGGVSMKLYYSLGQQKLCLYPTPYGMISASIKTSLIEFNFADRAGKLRVDYTIDQDNENFIKNSLRIEIEPLDNYKEIEKPKRLKIDTKV